MKLKEAKIAEKYVADTITDLSMGGPIDEVRRRILEVTNAPLTTVPIYQTVMEAGSFKTMTEYDLVQVIRKRIEEGISSIVVHAGFTHEMLENLRGAKRIMGMVFAGGSFTSAWMLQKEKEDPFFSRFDEVCKKYTLKGMWCSLLGTPRGVDTFTTLWMDPQGEEIDMNAELARRANDFGVQVISQGMGCHVDPNLTPDYVAHYKRKTGHRPLFVAGPHPIDIGVRYDHISGCVGGALAAGAGADYLCYITPSEHLALPNAVQVREGIVAFKIAAHIGGTLK